MPMQNTKTPFTNMTFTPDVPSSSLQPTEYNAGQNIETDVRSIKSVLGDQYILSEINSSDSSPFIKKMENQNSQMFRHWK